MNNVNRKVKLFWFSQTVGIGRGIEEIIDALGMLESADFELHLLGSASDQIKNAFIAQLKNDIQIYFYDPIPPDDIISFASQFDIGLASELSEPVNRDMCLTNKLFTYIQSGLAVLASNTSAQRDFIEHNHISGHIYSNTGQLITALQNYKHNPEILQQHKQTNYNLGQTRLNWDQEKEVFLHVVNSSLSD